MPLVVIDEQSEFACPHTKPKRAMYIHGILGSSLVSQLVLGLVRGGVLEGGRDGGRLRNTV